MAVARGAAATAAEIIRPDWSVPARVRSAITTRYGGVSVAAYQSFNLAVHVDDQPQLVAENRRRLVSALDLPAAPRWLTQVHSPRVVCADEVDETVAADAAWTANPGVVCAVLTADCLPVLLCDRGASRVAAVHAGWRGMCAGVLEQSVAVFAAAGIDTDQVMAWLGPAIGSAQYEVDAAVRDACLSRYPDCADSFTVTRPGHWQFDLYAAARVILAGLGVGSVSGGGYCTFSEERFYSYRRNATCGRQASLIWLADD